MSADKASRYFKRAYGSIATCLFLGVILLLVSHGNPNEQIEALLTHLGVALIIAAVFSLFLEVTEVKEFFEQRMTDVLCRSEYMKMLEEGRILALLVSCVETLGAKRTTNPTYEYNDLAKLLADDIVNEVIGKPYRKNFTETIEYSVLSSDELETLGSTVRTNVVKRFCETWFTLVSPSEVGLIDYEVSWDDEMDAVPGLEIARHFELAVKVNDVEVENIDLNQFVSVKDGRVGIEFSRTLKVANNSVVYLSLRSYQFGTTGLVYTYMTEPTHNVTVHFSSSEDLDLQADVFGLSGNSEWTSVSRHSVFMQYQGWLMSGHGYFIAWKKPLPKATSAVDG